MPEEKLKFSKETLNWLVENIILALTIFIFWHTSIIKPFKTLVVFLHETYHAIAALLTGGYVKTIAVTSHESGVTFISGGIPVVVYSAGYLGTAFTGALMIATGRSKNLKRYFPFIIGTLLLLSTILFVRNRYGFIFGLVTGAVFIFLFVKQFFFLKYITDFVGMMCVIYTIYDFMDFVNSKTNDATLLSHIIKVPAFIIYSTWIVLSIAMFFMAFRFAYRKTLRDLPVYPHQHR